MSRSFGKKSFSHRQPLPDLWRVHSRVISLASFLSRLFSHALLHALLHALNLPATLARRSLVGLRSTGVTSGTRFDRAGHRSRRGVARAGIARAWKKHSGGGRRYASNAGARDARPGTAACFFPG